MVIRIKDWHKFQHFKERRPPWIKLYRDILDDPEWHELDPLSAKVLVMLWLIASESEGTLPSVKNLTFRLRIFEKQLLSILSKLSHFLRQDDITQISRGYQDDTPEGETETEAYKEEGEGEKNPPPPLKITFLEYVKLTESEESKLVSKYGQQTTDSYISRLNNYIGSKGKKYRSHYHTILNWMSKDGVISVKKSTEKIVAPHKCHCGEIATTLIGGEWECNKCLAKI